MLYSMKKYSRLPALTSFHSIHVHKLAKQLLQLQQLQAICKEFNVNAFHRE